MIPEAEAVESPKKRARWPGYLLGLYAAACGGAALISAGVHPEGWAVFTKPLLGLIGLAGGLLVLLGDPWWKPLLRLWFLAQVPVIIIDPSGQLTRQPGLWFGFTTSSSLTSGNQVLQLEGYGVNLTGLFLLALSHWIIARKWYADVPGALWQFQVLRLVRTLFVCASLALVGYVGWCWAPLLLERDALMVIHCAPPGADVFAGELRLGSTPLVVTHEKLVEWGLSKPDGPVRCGIGTTALDESLVLSGNRGFTNLLLKPPWWCEKHFATWPSEWGPRSAPQRVATSTNQCSVRLVCRSQPGFVLTASEAAPQSCPPGQPVEFTVALRHNPPDPLVRAKAPPKSGQRATLAVTFMRGTAYETKEVALPPAWASPAVGSELKHTFKVPAPQAPGQYRLRLRYLLFEDASTQKRLDTDSARAYGFLEVK